MSYSLASPARSDRGRDHGVTLVELMVSAGILTVVMVPFGFLALSSSRAFSSLAQQSQVSSNATAVVDRLVLELSNGRLLDPANPAQSTYIRFDKVVDVVDGAPVYGDPIQIDLVATESSNTDDVDNDGDGIVDEGGVRIWIDRDPVETTPSIGSEDEVFQISALVAKDGLQFTQDGAMILIDLTVETVTNGTNLTFYIGSGALMN